MLQQSAYITGVGMYLPGDPIDNDGLEQRLGVLGNGSRRLRERMLEANGIVTRHYALDEHGSTTMLNEELAERAVRAAVEQSPVGLDEVGLLSVGTTQGDLPVPGFASMVHARLGSGPKEILSAGGVCCSGIAALRAAEGAVRLGHHRVAVSAGSELISRALRASRFDGINKDRRTAFQAEFLRWMLSDGAGAVVIQDRPRHVGLSLRIDWSLLESHAHRFPLCMYTGTIASDSVQPGSTWQDLPTPSEADAASLLNLRQDVALVGSVVALGVERYIHLVRDGWIEPDRIDHLLCHYSSEYLRSDIVKLMNEAGVMIPEPKWFTNLHTKGNTGAASIYIMLEEAVSTGRFSAGDRILLMVPESGRFSVAFAHLTCVGPEEASGLDTPAEETATFAPPVEGNEGTSRSGSPHDWMLEELALVWAGFEQHLSQVPLVHRIENRAAAPEDYLRLLVNMRQQVMEGARWITRAASNLTSEYTDLRADFIQHAAEEQRDFRMLEEDYVACGGSRAEIQAGEKNVGTEALSAYMFQQADAANPLGLLGAMYIIEGLGANKAGHWVALLQDQLALSDEQVTFLRYHGGADIEHTEKMFAILRSPIITREVARSIVKTAKVVARLYALQLEEIDHV